MPLDISAHGGPFGGGGIPPEQKPVLKANNLNPLFSGNSLFKIGQAGFGVVYNPKRGLMIGGHKPTNPNTCSVWDLNTLSDPVNLGHPTTQASNDVFIVGIRNNGDEVILRTGTTLELHTVDKATGALTFVRAINASTYVTVANKVLYSPLADVVVVMQYNTAATASKIAVYKGDLSAVLWSATVTAASGYPAMGAAFFDGTKLVIIGQIAGVAKLFVAGYNVTTGAVLLALKELTVNALYFTGTKMIDYPIRLIKMGTDLIVVTGALTDQGATVYGTSVVSIDTNTWTVTASKGQNYTDQIYAGYDSTNFYYIYANGTGTQKVRSAPKATVAEVLEKTVFAVPFTSTTGRPNYQPDIDYNLMPTDYEYKIQAYFVAMSTGTYPSSGYGFIAPLTKG